MSGSEIPVLRGDRVVLRPAGEADVGALAAMRAEPEVADWWGAPPTLEDFREETVGASGWVIEIDGRPGGWMEFHEEDDPMYRHVGFDIYLGAAFGGHGYGRDALRLAIDHFVAAGNHRFTIDPAAHNERAIRSYAAVGFRPVGVMRRYELGRDGSWHDGLLMDLLAADLAGDRG